LEGRDQGSITDALIGSTRARWLGEMLSTGRR
jgi:hypothetical protein